MHPLLLRQLKRFDLNPDAPPASPEAWQAVLERISRAYEDADNGRALLERSLMLTSQEMQSLHQRLQASRDEVLHKQQAAILRLTKSSTLHAGDLGVGLREITETAAETLEVERASVWLFDRDNPVLRCLDVYERGEDRHSDGIELPIAVFPEYFKAVRTEQVIAADDARQDPRTKEFAASYLVPLGITSMLDVPIRRQGSMVGVVCCEHVGPSRQWTLEETAFCTSIATLVSLAFDAEERRRLQEETIQSNRFLDSVIENLPIMVFVKDAKELRFVRWNKHAEDLVGISRHELIGRTDREFFPEPEADAYIANDREVLSGRALKDFPEEAISTRMNGARILHTRKIPILDERGTPQYLLGIAEDITERKRREEALRESEEKYRGLFESSQDAIMLLFPPVWKFTAGNPATLRLFGVENADRFTSMGPWDVSPEFQPDGERSMDKAPRMIETAMREGSHFFEWTHKRVDGEEFFATVLLTRIMFRGRVGLQAIVRDISHQKRTEAELRTVSALHQTIVDYAGHAIISTTPDGIIQAFNPAAESLLGYRADEMIGKQTPAVFHDPDEVAARAKMVSAELGVKIEPGFEVFVAKSRRSLPNEHEWTYIRKDGTRLTVVLNVTAIWGQGGAILGFLGIAHDITERKIVEQELRRTKEAAEAASVAKSQFLANMSHEIRTPMNGVLGMTQLLLSTALSGRQRHLADTVQRSAKALLGIIDEILDFSKMEAGRLHLETVDFSLRAIVQEIFDLVGESARTKALQLSSTIGEEIPSKLRGDPIRVRQVILNLVGNAIKFTPQGSVTLRAELLGEGNDQVVLRVTVQDTGIGVPPAVHGQIFDAFAQADGSTTRQFGGTGLGLTIVKRLVTLMGGEVGVDSRPGHGSSFWFTSRFLKCAAECGSPAIGISGPSTAAPMEPLGEGKRILLAEDSPVNTEVAIAMLELLGCRTEAVPNGRVALDRSAHEEFDLILMDCQMPEMDGFEATRRIRAREEKAGKDSRRIPIIALTAHAMKGDREQCLAAGMDDYMTKPFTQENLASMIDRWLSGKAGEKKPRRSAA